MTSISRKKRLTTVLNSNCLVSYSLQLNEYADGVLKRDMETADGFQRYFGLLRGDSPAAAFCVTEKTILFSGDFHRKS